MGEQLDQMRKAHANGVFGVYTFMGHDGHNAVWFTDQDGKEICRGESGRSFEEAAQRCIDRWRILLDAHNLLVNYGDGGATHADKH